MVRVLAVIAAIVAVILFVVVAAFNPTNPVTVEAWGFVCTAAAVGFLALDGVIPRQAP